MVLGNAYFVSVALSVLKNIIQHDGAVYGKLNGELRIRDVNDSK